MLGLILLIIALVLFGLAAFDVVAGRFNLIAGGLFFATLAVLVNMGLV